MGLNTSTLIKKLNKTCLDALQAGAGLCLSRTNPSVEVEHWLLKLSEAPDTDLPKIYRHFEVDPSRLIGELTRAVDRFKTGHGRTPTLSNSIDDASVGVRSLPVRNWSIARTRSRWRRDESTS